MFESAEIGHAIDKATYDAAVPDLREALLQAQYRLKAGEIPGSDPDQRYRGGQGRDHQAAQRVDGPRLIRVDSFDVPSDEELSHPRLALLAAAAEGAYRHLFGNWYSKMLEDRVHGRIKGAELKLATARAQRLERMLCDEGMLIFKFHLSKDQMNARLDSLKNDPLHSWRISPLDWQQSKTYDKFVRYGEQILRLSSRDFAPWYVIEGADERYRSLTVGRILLEVAAALARNSPDRAWPSPIRRRCRWISIT